jgi:hypothetical protein
LRHLTACRGPARDHPGPPQTGAAGTGGGPRDVWWRARHDSNVRPSAPQADALSKLSYGRPNLIGNGVEAGL